MSSVQFIYYCISIHMPGVHQWWAMWHAHSPADLSADQSLTRYILCSVHLQTHTACHTHAICRAHTHTHTHTHWPHTPPPTHTHTDTHDWNSVDWIANKHLTETDNYMKPAFSSVINSAVDMDLIKGTPAFNGKRSTVELTQRRRLTKVNIVTAAERGSLKLIGDTSLYF